MKSFAGLLNKSSAITKNLHRNRTGHQTRASTMKTLITTCLCSLAFALVLLGQAPPPAQQAPPTTGAQAPTNPAAAAQQPAAPGQQPATNLPPGQHPATNVPPGQHPPPPPGDPGAAGQPPAAGQPGVPGAATSPAAAAATSPVATIAPAPEKPAGVLGSNWLIDQFRKGGPVMWPILVVSIVALTVVLERCIWWSGRWFRRGPTRIEKDFTAIGSGDTAEASRLSRGSRDPVLRMLWNGLNHQHSSLEAALQVAAGIEIKRAGRFLVVMDTLVTLAPLLGLLGTITGLIRSFSFLGNE